jgi:hypothetical protein
MLGVLSLLGRSGGNGLLIDGFVAWSTFKCASSGGIETGGLALCVDETVGLAYDGVRATLGASALEGFRGTSFLGGTLLDIGGFTVEFEEDVDDSRTEGNPR